MAAAVESGEVAARMEALGDGVADLIHRCFKLPSCLLIFVVLCFDICGFVPVLLIHFAF